MILLLHAFSLAHACGGLQTRTCFCFLGLALPHFATHFCQACLRLVHQNESHKLASLRESCHTFCVYAMWGPSVACLRCGWNQTLTSVGQTCLTLGVAIFGIVRGCLDCDYVCLILPHYGAVWFPGTLPHFATPHLRQV